VEFQSLEIEKIVQDVGGKSMSKKLQRTTFEIIKDILEYCRFNSKGPTRIGQGCNCNTTLLNPLLDALVSWGLLSCIQIKARKQYVITNKGRDWLQNYYSLIKLMEV